MAGVSEHGWRGGRKVVEVYKGRSSEVRVKGRVDEEARQEMLKE